MGGERRHSILKINRQSDHRAVNRQGSRKINTSLAYERKSPSTCWPLRLTPVVALNRAGSRPRRLFPSTRSPRFASTNVEKLAVHPPQLPIETRLPSQPRFEIIVEEPTPHLSIECLPMYSQPREEAGDRDVERKDDAPTIHCLRRL